MTPRGSKDEQGDALVDIVTAYRSLRWMFIAVFHAAKWIVAVAMAFGSLGVFTRWMVEWFKQLSGVSL